MKIKLVVSCSIAILLRSAVFIHTNHITIMLLSSTEIKSDNLRLKIMEQRNNTKVYCVHIHLGIFRFITCESYTLKIKIVRVYYRTILSILHANYHIVSNYYCRIL